MNISKESNTVGYLEWLKLDKFLFEKVEKNRGVFENKLNLDDTPSNLVPAIREIIRKEILDEEAMIYIVDLINKGKKNEIDYDVVRRFLSEKIEDMFCELYIEEIIAFIGRGNDILDTYDFMKKTLNNLGGQTATHFITNGMEFFYNE